VAVREQARVQRSSVHHGWSAGRRRAAMARRPVR
jgi:hypothetical protein